MAALAVVTRLVEKGQHIVAPEDLYGGTSRLLTRVVPRAGVDVTNVNITNIQCALYLHCAPAARCPSRVPCRKLPDQA